MKKYAFVKILFLTIVLMFATCCEDEYSNARQMSLAEVKSLTGFEWFDKGYNDFTYYQKSIVKDISQYFAENKDSEGIEFLIFTSPTCECGNSYLKFPYFIKILDSSAITENYYKIFVIGDLNDNHPYSNSYKIKEIPALVVLKNGKPVYSVNDTIIKNNKEPYGKPSELDEAILAGIKKLGS